MFKNYLKITFRHLVKQKAYSIVNILGLAIAISSSLLIFLYVSFELNYDTFHQNAERIYRVRNDRIYQDIHDKSAGCPPALGPTLKKEFPEIVEFARVHNTFYMNNMVSPDTAVPHRPGIEENKSAGNPGTAFIQDRLFYAEPAFLRIFSFPMLKGDAGSALTKPNTAVISQSCARKYFGEDDPMEKRLVVTNNYGKQLYTVTGVFKDVPAHSHIKFEVLLSYETLIGLNSRAEYYWGWNAFNTYVLLSPGADARALEAKLPLLADKYKNHGEDYRRKYLLQPLTTIHLHSNLRHEPEINGNARTVSFLIIIGLFILLLAWTNYINLSTARSVTRAREVGIRKVLGSRRPQLIKQFMFEAAFLNILAVLIALIMVKGFLPFFNRLTGQLLTLSMLTWGNAWLWLGLLIIIGTILSALYPAFALSSFKPVKVLKGKSCHSSGGVFLRKALVVFQFTISIILIIGTLTVYNQLSFLRNKDLGMNIRQVLSVKIGNSQVDSTQTINRFKSELLNYPAIKSVTASSTVPGREYSNAASGIRPLSSSPEKGKRCFFISVDYDFFDFFDITILTGRKFSREFDTNKRTLILNEKAVELFGYETPEGALNQKIVFGGLGGDTWDTVGIIKDYHHKSLKESIHPIIFTLTENDANGRNHYFSIKIQGTDIASTVALVKQKWAEVFPGSPFEYFFLDEMFNNQYKSDTRFGKVFGLFAGLSIFISCLGLFGLISFTTLLRTREIGIRKTYGASIPDIIGLLAKETLLFVAMAILTAVPIAYYFMNSWLDNFATRAPLDIRIFLFSGSIALLVAMTTTGYHTLKAAFANPIESIRYE